MSTYHSFEQAHGAAYHLVFPYYIICNTSNPFHMVNVYHGFLYFPIGELDKDVSMQLGTYFLSPGCLCPSSKTRTLCWSKVNNLLRCFYKRSSSPSKENGIGIHPKSRIKYRRYYSTKLDSSVGCFSIWKHKVETQWVKLNWCPYIIKIGLVIGS